MLPNATNAITEDGTESGRLKPGVSLPPRYTGNGPTDTKAAAIQHSGASEQATTPAFQRPFASFRRLFDLLTRLRVGR
ncbi:hypothetical protein BN961_00024 [Afipia felis]|uniref:Uncharacterized protein n=1 Tax=Afipia felis TaxID=1035 RepID=A0A090MLU4_AFIFE|nr:hypothetical protein BN961_00024 [Afipia felis]